MKVQERCAAEEFVELLDRFFAKSKQKRVLKERDLECLKEMIRQRDLNEEAIEIMGEIMEVFCSVKRSRSVGLFLHHDVETASAVRDEIVKFLDRANALPVRMRGQTLRVKDVCIEH